MAKHDQVKGKEVKVLEEIPSPDASATNSRTLQPAVGETTGKKKKNQSIDISYLNAKGEEVTSYSPDLHALLINTKTYSDKLVLADMPKPMLIAAAAFGFNTTLRNAHNSVANAGGDGIAAVKSRVTALRASEWRSVGDGEEGIPFVIEAMIRAKKDGKAYSEGMEDKWLTEYRSLDKTGKAEWTKTMASKKPIEIAMLKIKAEKAALKAEKAMEGIEAGEDF